MAPKSQTEKDTSATKIPPIAAKRAKSRGSRRTVLLSALREKCDLSKNDVGILQTLGRFRFALSRLRREKELLKGSLFLINIENICNLGNSREIGVIAGIA